MSTELVNQTHGAFHLEPRVVDLSQNRPTVTGGLSDVPTTLQPATRVDRSVVVSQQNQTSCWEKLTPCQKTAIKCVGVVVGVGAIASCCILIPLLL